MQLSAEPSFSYYIVKDLILRAYELVLEEFKVIDGRILKHILQEERFIFLISGVFQR